MVDSGMDRPSIFQLNDLWLMWIPALIVGLIVFALGWNLTSPEGEPIPVGGWVTSIATILACLVIVFAFYWKRWKWVSQWAYRVLGVNYYYAPGATRYLEDDVAQDIHVSIRKWMAYREAKPSDTLFASDVGGIPVIAGVTCLFRPEKAWEHTAPGFWTRKVAGLTMGSCIEVGQGERAIEQTAHVHELSHVILSRLEGREVPEKEAHEKFKEIGV